MKKLFLAALLFASCGRLDTARKVEYPPQSERSEWIYLGVPGFKQSYLLTVDSIQYIIVSSGDGLAISFHRNLRGE